MKPALKGVLIGGAIGFIVFILLIRIYGAYQNQDMPLLQ